MIGVELEDVIIYIGAIDNRYKFSWRNLIVKMIEKEFSMNGNASKIVTAFEKEGMIEYVGELFRAEPNRLARRVNITKKGKELIVDAVVVKKLLASANKSCFCKTGILCGNCLANYQIAEKTRGKNVFLVKQYKVKIGEEGEFMSKMIVG